MAAGGGSSCSGSRRIGIPRRSAQCGVLAEDLDPIRKFTGLPIETPADEVKHRRERFRRQLRSVAEAVTFLVPRRDATGKAQSPSESLVFMHRLFAGAGGPRTSWSSSSMRRRSERKARHRRAGGACGSRGRRAALVVEDLRVRAGSADAAARMQARQAEAGVARAASRR